MFLDPLQGLNILPDPGLPQGLATEQKGLTKTQINQSLADE